MTGAPMHPNAAPIRPLDGITVVALEHAVAAPFATRQLADLGARVIKIERPGEGDFARAYDTTVLGQSSYFVWLNRGKESLTLDLKQAEARAVLDTLLTGADVLVQNLAPGAAGRMGLDFETLRAVNPSLIVCDISGFGDGGPYTDKKAYDLLIQASAGLIGLTGTPEHPSRAGASVADIAAGMYAYSGILSALLQRARTGEGLRVEVSMFEALTEWVSNALYFAHYGGAEPTRQGATHPSVAPYGPHRTGDGGSVIFGLQNSREWARFCEEVLARPELAGDPRFSDNPRRVANRSELTALIEARFAAMTLPEVEALLDGAGIANAPISAVADVWAHPQLAARDRWRSVMTPGGPIAALRPPATLSAFDPVMGDVPAVGEHTEAILATLGCDVNKIARLRSAGAI
ncbi:MAG TPA: CaiB/BaiF CoA-transferase family protein [Caulobacteraceae bacterium]|nr:CaiB/BaiF CoA-transferase family protein [Caulobacteraceae bacterium]